MLRQLGSIKEETKSWSEFLIWIGNRWERGVCLGIFLSTQYSPDNIHIDGYHSHNCIHVRGIYAAKRTFIQTTGALIATIVFIQVASIQPR
jgi:hypothetical protein